MLIAERVHIFWLIIKCQLCVWHGVSKIDIILLCWKLCNLKKLLLQSVLLFFFLLNCIVIFVTIGSIMTFFFKFKNEHYLNNAIHNTSCANYSNFLYWQRYLWSVLTMVLVIFNTTFGYVSLVIQHVLIIHNTHII